MDNFDNISENEIRIIGTNPEDQHNPRKRMWWYVAIAVLAVLLVGLVAFYSLHWGGKKTPLTSVEKVIKGEDNIIAERLAYVEIEDTIINNVSLHRFIPVNAKPKLVVGQIKEIPANFILGAMAADFGIYNGEYKVTGGFVIHGEMLSHSKSKYGFCAILNDTVVLGNNLSTSYFEQAIEENGDFFRQHALVHKGRVANKVLSKDGALRRSLCRLNDGNLCIIDTDMTNALILAVQRGVDVRIITPGVPDKKIIWRITRSYYPNLLNGGVKIYEYTPGFVHAKVAVSDNERAVVGTINLDYRSLYHHFECATYLYKTDCIGGIEQDFQKTLAQCRKVTGETIRHEKLSYKLLGYFMKFIAPLM